MDSKSPPLSTKKNLAQWLDYLEKLHPSEIELGLERSLEVAQRLLPDLFHSDNTQTAPFTIITVAGTNGKGSTIAFIEAILIESGYTTGTYTSPHFLTFNERIQINAQHIDDADLCLAFEKIDDVRENISLTYFEYTTLAALYYFYHQHCEVIILEVGLGGRLDVVNIVDADCSLVTTVDLDHQDWLGDNKEAIGYEKAGIYRHNKASIYGDMNPPHSLINYSHQIASQLLLYGKDYQYSKGDNGWGVEFADCAIKFHPINKIQSLKYPQLAGEIQFKNATNAIVALLSLQNKLDKLCLKSINQGVVKANILGRYQYLAHQPDVIVDVAHNPQAAKQLSYFLAEQPASKNHAIFSILKDKDIVGVISELSESFDSWHIIPIDSARALSTEKIKNNLQSHIKNKPITCYNDFSTAYNTVMEQIISMDNNPLENRVLIFGSFFSASLAMEYFHGN